MNILTTLLTYSTVYFTRNVSETDVYRYEDNVNY